MGIICLLNEIDIARIKILLQMKIDKVQKERREIGFFLESFSLGLLRYRIEVLSD
jgi:hypothetical protein